MKTANIDAISRFIMSLPPGPLSKTDLFVPELLHEEQGDMQVYYAPYDYINEQARIMIVGITPGFTQMELAVRTARLHLLDGRLPYEQVCLRAKSVASFAGSMRVNLLQMLDELRLPEFVGIGASGELFGERRSLLHTTSVIKYPAFKKRQNYTGHSPDMMKSEFLFSYVRKYFLEDLGRVKEALIIPLGKAVSDVIRHFSDEGLVAPERCLFDFPHPSGANGHRKKQFESGKAEFEKRIREWRKS